MRNVVRDLKKIIAFNYSSNKTIYLKISKRKFVVKEDDMRLKTRRFGSSVDLWECGKRVKVKGVNQELNVHHTSKITHENSGLSSF